MLEVTVTNFQTKNLVGENSPSNLCNASKLVRQLLQVRDVDKKRPKRICITYIFILQIQLFKGGLPFIRKMFSSGPLLKTFDHNNTVIKATYQNNHETLLRMF